MIEMVTLAEERLKKNRKAVFVSAQLPQRAAQLAEIAPILRGAVALPDPKNRRRLQAADFRFPHQRRDPRISSTARMSKRYALAGVITPDHTIRTKNWPMIAPAPDGEKLADFRNGAREAAAEFVAHYKAYFARNNTALQRRQGDARSGAARDARARPRPVRAWPHRRRMRGSPPISPKPRSRASPMPKRSATSRRSAKRTCSTANIGRWNRPSSARRRNCRSPARSR